MASNFPSRAKLSAIVQQAQLKRSGLIADCIFPPVQTPCRFEYIDWSNMANIQVVEDAIGCKTDVKEIDPEAFTLVTEKVQDHALSQSMGDCCVTACGDDAAYAARKEQGKTLQLMNRLLIGREKRAIAAATDESEYTDNLALVPGASTAVNEGGMYNIDLSDMRDPNFALLKWFMPIQTNNYLTGRRTKAVMSQNRLNDLLVHPNFIGAGCLLDAKTTADKVAALLGVDEICVADAGYNNGVGQTVSLTGLWPDEYILFTASYDLVTPDEQQVAFGITAFNKGFRINNWIKPEKGPDEGVMMQKMSHDFTEIVLSYKAATLVKVNLNA